VADESLTSLSSFRRAVHFRALPGGSGGGSKCHGANAGHVEVKVPLGTIFRERGAPEGAPPLAELVAHGERALLAAGGRGGKGNAAFKTHRNNAPTMSELGEPGEERWVDVELRVVADVGIVGVPNAGKSTLLSVLSAAKPKIADYPFTTLVPNLGVCELDFRTTVFADVPGLLEGAHAGVGLGHEFLRHVSRCRAVVHVVDGSRRDPVGDYAALRNELALFSPDLEALPQVVAYNKCDVPESADYFADVLAHLVGTGVAPENVVAVSAATGDGVTALVRRVRAVLDALPVLDGIPRATDAVNLTAPIRVPAGVRDYEIEFDGGVRAWTVTGPSLDRFVSQTDWNYYESALRFQKVLEASGARRRGSSRRGAWARRARAPRHRANPPLHYPSLLDRHRKIVAPKRRQGGRRGARRRRRVCVVGRPVGRRPVRRLDGGAQGERARAAGRVEVAARGRVMQEERGQGWRVLRSIHCLVSARCVNQRGRRGEGAGMWRVRGRRRREREGARPPRSAHTALPLSLLPYAPPSTTRPRSRVPLGQRGRGGRARGRGGGACGRRRRGGGGGRALGAAHVRRAGRVSVSRGGEGVDWRGRSRPATAHPFSSSATWPSLWPARGATAMVAGPTARSSAGARPTRRGRRRSSGLRWGRRQSAARRGAWPPRPTPRPIN